jgi:hypothetical protein
VVELCWPFDNIRCPEAIASASQSLPGHRLPHSGSMLPLIRWYSPWDRKTMQNHTGNLRECYKLFADSDRYYNKKPEATCLCGGFWIAIITLMVQSSWARRGGEEYGRKSGGPWLLLKVGHTLRCKGKSKDLLRSRHRFQIHGIDKKAQFLLSRCLPTVVDELFSSTSLDPAALSRSYVCWRLCPLLLLLWDWDRLCCPASIMALVQIWCDPMIRGCFNTHLGGTSDQQWV